MILIWALYLRYQSTTGRGRSQNTEKPKQHHWVEGFTSYSLKSGLNFAGIIKSIGITTTGWSSPNGSEFRFGTPIQQKMAGPQGSR